MAEVAGNLIEKKFPNNIKEVWKTSQQKNKYVFIKPNVFATDTNKTASKSQVKKWPK